jgi:F-type H+-transporting ATPase subunit delta
LERVGAEVTTAIPLNDEETARLKKSLAVYAGREIRMTTTVDPAIVGGVVARIGDRIIDGSLRTRLARLKQNVISHDLA